MRLIIIANRLPIKMSHSSEHLTFKRSEGGLATGLASLHSDIETHWIGWPGLHVDEAEKCDHVTQVLANHKFHPVFLSPEQIEHYYEGYCNNVIWPLCHYFFAYIHYDKQAWSSYEEVNRLFLNAAMRIIQPGDRVWIQDYQLMLLPSLLRKAFPDITIGYFHHIPFPSFELFRVLPERAKILEGLLGADLIGFHTHDYMRHFISAAYRVLGLECELDEIRFEDRLIQVNAFPMGINFKQYYRAATRAPVQAMIKTFRQQFGDQKLLLSVDRLDYSKGILHRLRGFATALERWPDLRERVSLVMLLVPSRANVPEYASLKKQIDQMIGELNGRYSSPNWTPVHYFYRSFSQDRLLALYHTADIALVTPLRDGMNLVCKEFVAAKRDTPGVLILSERAGAAIELTDALKVNPNSAEEVSDAIHTAMEMPVEEQLRRLHGMQKLLARQNVDKWATDFIEALDQTHHKSQTLREMRIKPENIEQIKSAYHQANKRLILLDYDGTLTRLQKQPDAAAPDELLRETLRRLAKDPCNTVAVCSGRDRDTLDQWLGDLPISLAAEHGAFYKDNVIWQCLNENLTLWDDDILSIMTRITDQTHGAHIEKKRTALVWHYRNCDAWLANLREKQLIDALMIPCARLNLRIMRGNKVVEIKPFGFSKGTEAERLLKKADFGFILAMGDDVTDEDMFRSLPNHAITIHVGGYSNASRCSMGSQAEVLPFLNALCDDA